MWKYFNIKNLALLLIFLFVGFNCTKEQDSEEQDYRNNFIGEYKFVIHHIVGDKIYGDWLDSTYSRYGFVKIYGEIQDSLLKIHYGTDTIQTMWINGIKIVLTENTPLKLSSNNILSYPGPVYLGPHSVLNGKFINYDSLLLYVNISSILYYNNREIRASKIYDR